MDKNDQKEPTLEESVHAVMQTLPPVIHDYLTSGKYTQVAEQLAGKYDLRVDQAGTLEREIMLLLMGIETPDDFTRALVEEAKLNQLAVRDIAKDVNAQIFAPLRAQEEKGGFGVSAAKPEESKPGVPPVARPTPPATPPATSAPVAPAPAAVPTPTPPPAPTASHPVPRPVPEHVAPLPPKHVLPVRPVTPPAPSQPQTPPPAPEKPAAPEPIPNESAPAPKTLPGLIVPPTGPEQVEQSSGAIHMPPLPKPETAEKPPVPPAPAPAPETSPKAYNADPYREPIDDVGE